MKLASKPLFVIEDPNFMGLPTEEGQSRASSYRGPKSIHVPIKTFYVDSTLQDIAGYDIATWATGDILDKDVQLAELVTADLQHHKAAMVTVKYNDFRYGYLVTYKDARRTLLRLYNLRSVAVQANYTRLFL